MASDEARAKAQAHLAGIVTHVDYDHDVSELVAVLLDNPDLLAPPDTEAAEVSALRAALERIDQGFACAGVTPTPEHTCRAFPPAEIAWCQRCIARDALGRYPKEASDG